MLRFPIPLSTIFQFNTDLTSNSQSNENPSSVFRYRTFPTNKQPKESRFRFHKKQEVKNRTPEAKIRLLFCLSPQKSKFRMKKSHLVKGYSKRHQKVDSEH